MRILITIFSFLFVASSWSQQYFYKLYSGNSFDKGEDIIETADTSYLVTGSSGSWGGNAQAYLMKLDSVGNYLWSQSYGGDESEEAVSVIERPGSGYYLAGMSNSLSQGNFDAMLIKTDLNGNQEWMKTYPNPAWDRITDAVMTKDTGLVLVGYRQGMMGASSDILLLRIDKNGDTLWTKTFGTIGEDQATSITRFQDSLYLMIGDMFVPDSNLVKGCFITFNDQGTILSQVMIGPKSGAYHLSDIEVGENKYYLVGYRAVNEQNHDNYIRILDGNAVLQSEYTEADNSPTSISDSQFDQVVFMPNPTYMLSICFQYRNLTNSLFSYDLNNGLYDAANAYWMGLPTTEIINQGLDQCSEMIPTHDKGFISVGWNTMVNDGQNGQNGGSNIYVFKYFPGHIQPLLTDTVFTFHQLVGMNEITQQAIQLKLYPNPTNLDLNVELSQEMNGIYEVLDINGKKIFDGELQSSFTIPMQMFEHGMYFLKIENHLFKFVKN
ncbi:MAG: T9SS type A sorting domain-containing protein [Flavobacteriales bacterium]